MIYYFVGFISEQMLGKQAEIELNAKQQQLNVEGNHREVLEMQRQLLDELESKISADHNHEANRIINNVLITLETAAKRGRIRVLYSLHVIRNTPSDSLQ